MTDAIRPADDLTATNGAMLVIISGPSGVGKDTIIDALRERPHDPDYHYVVTCTTRARRPGEVDGVDYHFLDPDTFAAWRAAGEFLEASEVHENWYGTPRGQVREALHAGRDVVGVPYGLGPGRLRDRVDREGLAHSVDRRAEAG